MPTISLVINTYNNPMALDAVLRRIESGKDLPEQVLIADDGSGEETRQLVEQWKAKSSLGIEHCRHEDAGFRRSRILNLSLTRATGEYIVFLDGDCLPMPCFIKDHRALAEKGFFVQGRRAFIVQDAVKGVLERGDRLFPLFLKGKITGVAKAVRYLFPVIKRNQDLRGALGCNLAIWRDDLVAVNGYDQRYEGWGIEDSDLCVRLYNLGLQRKFVYGRAIMFHLDHPQWSKDHLPERMVRLQEAVDSKRVRCENGLDQSLERLKDDAAHGGGNH
jgi:glycosyltransferase involved in cell wall biosynthesis